MEPGVDMGFGLELESGHRVSHSLPDLDLGR